MSSTDCGYDAAYKDEDGLREMTIDGSYLGTEDAQIATQKTVVNTSTYAVTTTNVTATLNCYKVKHRITIVTDDSGDSKPGDWAEMTAWIPTGGEKTNFLIFAKATYVDSEDEAGEWSWYVSKAMQDEMDDPPAGTTVAYTPVVEGSFHGYDTWAFYGLYGHGLSWFGAFAEGGGQKFHEGSWSLGGYGCSYDCDKVKETIGGYTFDAWSLKYTCTAEGETGGYQGTFSKDLPLPIYAKVRSSVGSDLYWEYEMTDLELE